MYYIGSSTRTVSYGILDQDNKESMSYIRLYSSYNRLINIDMHPADDTFITAFNSSVRMWDLRSQACQGCIRVNPAFVKYDRTGDVFYVACDGRSIATFDRRNVDKVRRYDDGDDIRGQLPYSRSLK